VGGGRLDDSIKDLGGVGFGKDDLGGATGEEVDLEQPVGHGVAAFVLAVEGLFAWGCIRKSEGAVGCGTDSTGGDIGGGLAHGFEVQIFVAIGKINSDSHGLFLS